MNFKKFYIHLPILILLVEWVAVIYLHYTNPYHFIVMSKGTLGIIVTGLVFIILGYYLVHSFYINDNRMLLGDQHSIKLDEAFIGKFILVFSFIVVIGLILIVKEVAKITNNLSMYFDNPFMVREKIISMSAGEISGISKASYTIGSYLGTFMYPLSVLGGIMVAQKSPWRFTGIIPFLLVIVYSLINLSRFGLITSMGLWFFSLIYYGIYINYNDRKKLTYKTAFFLLLAVVFIMIFFISIIKLRTFSMLNIEYWAQRSIYSYFSGSGAAFEKFLFNEPTMTFGASSFRSLVKWFARVGLLDNSIVMGAHNSFYNVSRGIPMSLNTYTFAKSPYEDFGIIGVSVISLLWGMFVRFSIEKCFRKFSIINLFFVSLGLLSLFMSFYEFFFHGIVMFIYWFILLKFIEEYLILKGAITSDTR